VANNSGNTPAVNPGVGMPAALKLGEFGQIVMDAWPDAIGCFHVGSSLFGKTWRDVDVRLMLDDEDFRAEFGADLPRHDLPRWRAMCRAYAALGEQMTGLPIDFQIHPMTWANDTYPEPRSALGVLR
jgi:hypothetical protein